MIDPRPHPFAHELAYDSDYGRELQAEARAEQEQRRRQRTCLECGVRGGHNAGCPADEDDEGDSE